MEKTKVWYSIENGGDGSAYPSWFLSGENADLHNNSQSEGWGETCTGSVETFTGSDIHKKATKNSKALCEKCGHIKEIYGKKVWCPCK